MPLMLNSVPQKYKLVFNSGFCDDIFYCVERDAEQHDVLISLEKARYVEQDDGEMVSTEQPLPVLTLSLNRMVNNFNTVWQEPFAKQQELVDWIMVNLRQSIMSMANWQGVEFLPHAHYYDMLFAYPHIEDPAITDVQQHLELYKYQLFSTAQIN